MARVAGNESTKCVALCWRLLCVRRFDLRAVSDGSGPSSRKGGTAADLLTVPKKVQQQTSKLRYRDGKVVTTKGEKVIIEKVGEEWDGGSRCAVLPRCGGPLCVCRAAIEGQ